jgi:DNA-binding PadR family transcriptional regulator
MRQTAGIPPHWFHILLSLAGGDRHGLAIIDDVAERTGGRLRLWPGVLYGALKKMTDEGLVADTAAPAGFSASGGKPRFYRITPKGRRASASEAAYLASIVDAARARRLLDARSR